LAIGNYDSGWNKLFDPILETLKLFPSFLLVTDGDTSILKGIKSLNIIFQRCLWHIPHQAKFAQTPLRANIQNCLFIDKPSLPLEIA